MSAELIARVCARIEHEWECDTVTMMQGPCNCDRPQLITTVETLTAERDARDAALENLRRAASESMDALRAELATLREMLVRAVEAEKLLTTDTDNAYNQAIGDAIRAIREAK